MAALRTVRRSADERVIDRATLRRMFMAAFKSEGLDYVGAALRSCIRN
jgi:hypothetical protein